MAAAFCCCPSPNKYFFHLPKWPYLIGSLTSLCFTHKIQNPLQRHAKTSWPGSHPPFQPYSCLYFSTCLGPSNQPQTLCFNIFTFLLKYFFQAPYITVLFKGSFVNPQTCLLWFCRCPYDPHSSHMGLLSTLAHTFHEDCNYHFRILRIGTVSTAMI